MKTDPYNLLAGYGNLMWTIINTYVPDEDNTTKDQLRDSVFDKLWKVKLRKNDPRAIKSLVCKTTSTICTDFIRRRNRRGIPCIIRPRVKPRMPRGRPPIDRCHSSRFSPRPHFYLFETYLNDHGLGNIANLKLLRAWCDDFSIKEIAKQFRLSPVQAKGRLQYLRRKIVSLLQAGGGN